MRLSYTKLETRLSSEKINIVVAENASTFCGICGDLFDAINGCGEEFVLVNDEDKEVGLAKVGLIISNPFEVDIHDKKLAGKLYTELSRILDENFSFETTKIGDDIAELMKKLDAESPVPIDYEEVLPTQGLLKMCGVSVKEDCDSLAEKLGNYLSAVFLLCGISCVFFVNLKSYFTDAELEEIYKLMRYNNVLCLSLESAVRNKRDDEFTLIIDNDLCEIVV